MSLLWGPKGPRRGWGFGNYGRDGSHRRAPRGGCPGMHCARAPQARRWLSSAVPATGSAPLQTREMCCFSLEGDAKEVFWQLAPALHHRGENITKKALRIEPFRLQSRIVYRLVFFFPFKIYRLDQTAVPEERRQKVWGLMEPLREHGPKDMADEGDARKGQMDIRARERGVLSPSCRGVFACFRVFRGVAPAVPGGAGGRAQSGDAAFAEWRVAVGFGDTEPPLLGTHFLSATRTRRGLSKGGDSDGACYRGTMAMTWSGSGSSVRPGRASALAALRLCVDRSPCRCPCARARASLADREPGARSARPDPGSCARPPQSPARSPRRQKSPRVRVSPLATVPHGTRVALGRSGTELVSVF